MTNNIKNKITNAIESTKHLHGIVLFFLVLFAGNLLWKLSIGNNDQSMQVLLWGHWDLSNYFAKATHLLVMQVAHTLHFFGMNVHVRGYTFLFHNGHAVDISWSCTCIKQMFLFILLILCSFGKWKHKWWYIIVGLFIIYGVNLIRVSTLVIIAEKHYEMLNFWHLYIMKYAFYGIMFLLWMIWDLFFASEKQCKV